MRKAFPLIVITCFCVAVVVIVVVVVVVILYCHIVVVVVVGGGGGGGGGGVFFVFFRTVTGSINLCSVECTTIVLPWKMTVAVNALQFY